MRHRRRLHTQTIQRKKTRSTRPLTPVRSRSWFSRLFKLLWWIVFIALIGYSGYRYLWPLAKEKLPALNRLGQESTFETSEQEPALPLQEKPQPAPPQREEVFIRAIQLEILNGCGEQGVAQKLADRLMEAHYDVVNTGNYLRNNTPYFDVEKTRLIDQINTDESRKKTEELARLMGIDRDQIESFSNPNPIADITIIIGKDFNQLAIFKGKDE